MSELQPPITVLIPTKDRREMVLQAVESACRQTLLPTVILVIDNGSSDGTQAALAALEPGPVPIEVIEGPGLGVGPARNCGLDHCSTPLVCFLDSDDLLREDAIELAMLIFSGRSFGGAREEFLTKPSEGAAYSLAGLLGSESDFNPPWGIASVEALKRVGHFSEHMPCAVDYDLLLRLCASGEQVQCLREPVYHYRLDPSRVTVSSNQARNYRNRLIALDRLQQEYPAQVEGVRDSFRSIQVRFRLRLCKALRRQTRLDSAERRELRRNAAEAFQANSLRLRVVSNLLSSYWRSLRA